MSAAIVTGGTKKDVEAMAVLAINIREKTPMIADELIIYHDGISAKDQAAIARIMKTRFIRYNCPISWFKLMRNKTIRYFSPLVFCKYECFKLLEEYDTVIWTDYDVLIKEDISEIKTVNNNMAFVINDETPLKKMFNSNIDTKDMTGYDLLAPSVTMPLFVLKKQLKDYMTLYKWCYEKTRELLPYLYLPEQCIVTLLMQEFELKCDSLSIPVYCMHPQKALEETKILHAYGQPKFWNGLYNESWQQYYEEWKRIRNSI